MAAGKSFVRDSCTFLALHCKPRSQDTRKESQWQSEARPEVQDAVYKSKPVHKHFALQSLQSLVYLQIDEKRMDALAELDRMQITFEDSHQYLLKLLTTKSLKIGDKSGIQCLVTMLNFNKFYR